MAEARFNLRLNRKEKELLKIIVRKNGMKVTDYIKYRLFHNNPEISDEKFIYESPSEDKHNYLLMGILQDIYLTMLEFIAENKSEEELQHLKNLCREQAKKNIAHYGYLKVKRNE